MTHQDFGSHRLGEFEGIYLLPASPRSWTGERVTRDGTLIVAFAEQDGRWHGILTWLPEDGSDVVTISRSSYSSKYCGRRLKRALRARAKQAVEDAELDRQVRAISKWLSLK